mmetsp:Transcript_5196/g.9544  ORF Transcript_5196/g.9544 Transcript_5196/m.9544 type:complete len:379 (+) Transcript_5196:36-1172(+)
MAVSELASGRRASGGRRGRRRREGEDLADDDDWKSKTMSTAEVAYDGIQDFLRQEYWDKGNQIWRQNEFSDLQRYFIKRGAIKALSKIKDNQFLSPTEVVTKLIGLLKDNDNSRNRFSDTYYLADLIRCLGEIRLSRTEEGSIGSIWEQISRYLKYDRVLSSYRNLISCACLEATCCLQLAGLLPLNRLDYKAYTSYGNYDRVRLTAYTCLIRLCAKHPRSGFGILELIMEDRAPGVTRDALRAWAESWERQPKMLSYYRNVREPQAGVLELRDGLWNVITDHPDDILRFTARRLYFAIWEGGGRTRKRRRRPGQLALNSGGGELDGQIYLSVQMRPPPAMMRCHEAKQSLMELHSERTKSAVGGAPSSVIRVPVSRK